MNQSESILQITDLLFKFLERIIVPLGYTRKNVSNVGIRSITFGKVRKLFKKIEDDDSIYNTKFPEIWNLIQFLGQIMNIKFTSVQLNKNVVCLPHKDKNNEGDSVIISFGDYSGGCLVYNGKVYDTLRPLIFDGRKEHYNTEITNGTKYSLVFFNIK